MSAYKTTPDALNNQYANETQAREEQDFADLHLAALEKLDAAQRTHHALLPGKGAEDEHRLVNLYKMGRETRKLLVNKALNTEDQDHEELLMKLKTRMDAANIRPSTVEVRFEKLSVVANIYVGDRSLPTVLNSYRNFFEAGLQMLRLIKTSKRKFTILDGVSGVLKPGRMTLLLGPPGAGKSTMLKALAGKLQHDDLQVDGNITYNGSTFAEFIPERTAAYIDQTDLHLPEITVRETMDFAARCQGVGHKADELEELRKAESANGHKPDPVFDAFLKASTVEGKRESIVTDYMIRILGLEVCADTVVGDAMLRGISGGQKKRVTTAEMVVGPTKTLFMDEISTGLDSSTTFMITKAMRDFAHLRNATVTIALLQPTPESYDLFDDVMLLAEGHIIYHGPRSEVVAFFESCGFKCPERKGVPDFLQEVTSKKDQEQYWSLPQPYRFVPVLEFADAFQKSNLGRSNAELLTTPFDKSSVTKDPLVHKKFALNNMQAFKACLNREWLLVKRNMFVYVFKAVQTALVAIITATLFLRTHIHTRTYADANNYSGFLFFTLIQLFFNGIAEMTFTIDRMPVFFKQRANLFFPTWAFVMPTSLVRVPIALIESFFWVIITYWSVNLAQDAGRFFMFWLLCALIHNMAVTLFRAIGALARNLVVANALGALVLLIMLMLGGFVLTKPYIHPWWIWFYWLNPLQFAQRALLINEFSAPRWSGPGAAIVNNQPLGKYLLTTKGLPLEYWWTWVGVGVLIGYCLLCNYIVVFAHQFLAPLNMSAAVMSEEALEEREQATRGHVLQGIPEDEKLAVDVDGNTTSNGNTPAGSRKAMSKRQIALAKSAKQMAANRSAKLSAFSQKHITSQKTLAAQGGSRRSLDSNGQPTDSRRSMNLTEANVEKGMVLPFEPMIMTFKDVHYFVDLPSEMQGKDLPQIKEVGGKKMLELLCGISGAFRPGILTSLMGVSGAGKTTLMDVLAGRKTGGHIDGDVRINGHTKVQETFARISGYVEQTDVHSPQTTVREALAFSASLRINGDVDRDTIEAYVDEVMELVELSSLRGVVVGTPGMSGLSVEQRKRLTIAVELVANPSVVFMDEPTSGLDARAAAIVMRAVRNIVNTGRTIVCTIHQPSIDIFEAFDDLLLLKRGGRTIYAGSLGKLSADLISYFEAIPNVPKISGGINPATWMLEVTTPGMEERLGVDFADIFDQSSIFQYASGQTNAMIDKASVPEPGSQPLHFATEFAHTFPQQVMVCFHKFWITYWRTPEYNGTRFSFTVGVALLFGTIFWKLGNNTSLEQTIFNVLGALFASTLFLGILNAVFVQPVISDERAVMYRERAAGMYDVMAWYLGLVIVECLYLLAQGALYTCIVYFMCGFEKDAGKFFWFMLFLILTIVYFTFYGIAAVAVTPNLIGAAVLSGAFYGLFNLFAGFVIFEKSIPGWWIWAFWGDPVNWTLRGLITSQLGDVTDTEVQLSAGGQQTPKEFIYTTFGYKKSWLGYDVLVLVAFCAVFILGAGAAIKKFNFQRR